MRILALAASTSSTSINQQLAEHVAGLLAGRLQDAQVEVLELRALDLPLFSEDVERESGAPAGVARLLDAVHRADAIVMAFAEHNRTLTAAGKNALDWASRSDLRFFQERPMLLLSTSTGARGGVMALRTGQELAARFGAEVVTAMPVPTFEASFRAGEGLVDPAVAAKVGMAVGVMAGRLNPALRGTMGASFWDERYAQPFAAYGDQPNAFVRAVAGGIPHGPVLVLAAGEGRDAVHLAKLGHEVTALDLSGVALAHAQQLAAREGVSLHTVQADLAGFDLGDAKWAGIVCVWAHMPAPLRAQVHRAAVRALKPGGQLVLEAYAPTHLSALGHGGPLAASMLMTPATLRAELEGLELVLCQEVQREVDEGRDHQGESVTTQVLAVRPA